MARHIMNVWNRRTESDMKTLIARFLNETNDEDEKKEEKKSGNGKWGEYYDHWAFNGLDSAVTCMLMGLKYYTFTNTSKMIYRDILWKLQYNYSNVRFFSICKDSCEDYSS